LESDIKVAMGGTIAEELVYGEISNGATSDLQHANRIARRMVTYFGMSGLGRVFYPEGDQNPFLGGLGNFGSRDYSEETAREIDMEIRLLIEKAITEVHAILQARRGALEAIARLLLEKETIDGNELRSLLEDYYPGPKLVPSSVAITPAGERREPADGDGGVRETLP
jgi:cell division protease FtsH